MNVPVAKPWIHTTAAGVVAAAEKLKQENPRDLFLLLVRAAASGEWDTFIAAFEKVSRVKGIKLLLPAPDGFPMRYAYESAGLPVDHWPVFIGALEIAHAIGQEAGENLKSGKRLRDLVLERTFALPSVRGLPHAHELAQNLAV